MTQPIAGRVVAELVEQGAQSVALVGSRARGDATADSDLDLAVIGEGPQYRLEIHDGLLVSVGWAPSEEQTRRLYDPRWLGTHVPGWRHAVLLRDPEGHAAEIKDLAISWDWSLVATECDTWAAETISGLAEEALRLVTSLRTADVVTAGVQRSILALQLPAALAIHRRILYGSESNLWGLVADEFGAAWRVTQASALGLHGDDLDSSCRAALRLFELATDDVREILDDRQRAVVEHVLRRARDL